MTEPPASWSPDVFDRLYALRPDPWNFTRSEYERKKYAATLDALPARSFRSAFEIGCSIGVLTRQLAARCDALLAVDVAERALAQARFACAGLDHVTIARMQIPSVWPAERFDLILLSEVLYLLGPDDVRRTAEHTLASLSPAGVVLLVNWTGETNSPCTGDEAAETFSAACAPRLRPALQKREPNYRLDLLRSA